MKKRALILSGSILGTVALAIMSVIVLMAVTVIGDVTAGAAGAGAIMVLSIIILLMCVTGLVLNIISITTFGKSKASFAKAKATVVAAIVFDFIIVLYTLYTTIVGASTAGTVVIYVLIMLALLAGAILKIVDLCFEGKRVENVQDNKEAKSESTVNEQ